MTEPAGQPVAARAPPRRAPLTPTLAFIFLNSLGTGAVTSGVFFLARQEYGFDATGNLLLSLTMGVIYIGGALGVGPAAKAAARRFKWLSSRGVMVGLMLMLAASCGIPSLAKASGISDSWPIWMLICIYGPLTGALWPLAESFVSGGRRGPDLRRATGRFNITWSLAVVASFWLMAPLIESQPLTVLLGLGAMHIVSLAFLIPMGAEPGKHLDDGSERTPPIYHDLLRSARYLLVTSYVLLAALNPLLPITLARSELAVAWHTPLTSAWMASRLVMFFLMERTSGWHGKRWVVPTGAALLGVGFGGSLLLPDLVGGSAGLVVLAATLAGFGCGAGLVYAAAIYYAMAVGDAAVEAGGTHEALIGAGYASGPLLMLGGLFAARTAGAEPWTGQLGVIVVSLVLLTLASAVAFRGGRMPR